jgi:hypothetical protein
MIGQATTHRSHCQNCGSPLQGPYCSACGQHDVDYSDSFWHIVEDGLEGALHFDGKFFKSARYIFTRPGFLTTEFISGCRVRYMHPVRLYIFASFLFFAVSLLTSHNWKPHEGSALGAPAGKDLSTMEETSPKRKEAPLNPETSQIPPAAVKQSWLDDPLRITVDPQDKVSEKDFTNEIWHLLPAMLILCLPLLALILKAIYLKSGRPYLEHLIFALHVQTLAFLSFLLIKAGGALASLASKEVESIVGFILLLGMFGLIYRSFRTVYRQSRGKTALKLLLALAGYGLVLLFAFMGLGAASGYMVS